MEDLYGPVLFGAFAFVFVPLVLAALATDDSARAKFERHGATIGGVALAIVAVTTAVVGLFAVGRTPTDGFALPVVGLYVSAVGLVFGIGYARRLAGLLRAERMATGDETDGHVAVTGLVGGESAVETPFFERPAVAWEWEVAVENRNGTNYEGRRAWAVERTGQGGVPFVLDDGSGPLRVDPTDARLELVDERTEELDPGRAPGRAAEVADLDMGGERFRFTERVLRPERTATVVGHAIGGELTGEAGPLVVASGTASDLRWTLALKTVGLAGASLTGTWVCLGMLASLTGVALLP